MGHRGGIQLFTSLLGAALACSEPPLPPAVPVAPLLVPDCIPMLERLQHLDQPTALGFSAVELLGRIAGETQSPLLWLPPPYNPEHSLRYGPESGRSQLSVRITPVEGELFYRYEQLSDTAPEDTVCAEGVLEIPVSVSLRSEGLALDEAFPARLAAKSAYRAELSHHFAPGTWNGGFRFTEVTSLDPERVVSTGPLSLTIQLWEGGSQGSLTTEIMSQPKAQRGASPEPWPGAFASSEPLSLAAWPSAELCADAEQLSLPSDARPLGFSVLDVLGALEQEKTRHVTWADGAGTELELSFVPPGSELCQGTAESLSFQTHVRLHTADGRLEAELPVQISAAAHNGAISLITVQSIEPVEGASAPLGAASGAPTRVTLDASFQRGTSAGTITVTAARAGAPDGAEPVTSELDSARWNR